MRGLLRLVMLFALSSPRLAHAADTVLLFQVPELRPGLCAALRLQLTEVATVVCRADVGEGTLAPRLGAASAALAAQGARLGVLLERDPDPDIVRMVLVGAAADQAVLALERIEDRRSPDVDRSLALKVRDAFEVMREAEARAAVAAAAPSSPAPEAARAPLAALLVQRKEPRPIRALIEAGGGLSRGEQTRALALLGLGVRFSRAHGFTELMLSGQLASRTRTQLQASGPARAQNPPGGGEVREEEWGLALGLRGAKSFGPLALGAFVELGAVYVRALGITGDGRVGDKARGLARTAAGLDLRLRLLRGLGLRLAPALTFDLPEQTFELDGQPALELGRVRVLVPLTLVLDLALGRAGSRDAS